MYAIEKRPAGYLLTFSGIIGADEMTRWYEESINALEGATPPFGVIIDMRTLTPLTPDIQSIMVAGQKAYMNKGMKRSCVILANSITAMQFKRLAKESGIYAFERYVDASAIPDWKKTALSWVKDGIDPDL